MVQGKVLLPDTGRRTGKPKPLGTADVTQKKPQSGRDGATKMLTLRMLRKDVCQLVPRVTTVCPAMPPFHCNEAFQEESNWP